MTAPATTGAATPLILSLQDVNVHYGAIHALKGVSLEIRQGEIVALIGANGAGKTSTLRATSGMIRPSKGRVSFLGQDTTALKAHKLVPLGMAHAPEGRGIFSNLSVEENLHLGAYTRTDRDAIAGDLERVFGLFPLLKERLQQAAGTLSGGQQQMLAVGRALMSRPKLLLLDEPSLGLAPQVVELIFKILRDINAQGVSILLVEQNAAKALGVCHRAYVLETGEIAMTGTGAELLSSEAVRKAYLGE